MIRPKRAFIIALAAARARRKLASRLMRMTSDHSSSFIRRIRLSRVTPALLTRMSRSEEHTSEIQSLMRISYAVFCLKKKKNNKTISIENQQTQNTLGNESHE